MNSLMISIMCLLCSKETVNSKKLRFVVMGGMPSLGSSALNCHLHHNNLCNTFNLSDFYSYFD